MTIKNKKIAKRACAVMLSMSMAMPVGIPAVNVLADEPDIAPAPSYTTAYEDEGYKYVWGDEFDGNTLNLEDWNVEEHEPGWVNAELQAYPNKDNMADNIKVADGKLKITPTAEKKEVTDAVSGEVLAGTGFDATNWSGGAAADGAGSVTYEDGKATVIIENSGTDTWHIQLQQSGLTLTQGHKYAFSVKAKSNVARNVLVNLLDPENSYAWYGGSTFTLGAEEKEFTFEADLSDEDGASATSDTIALQLNFGKLGEAAADTAAATVTLSDISLVDLTAEPTGSVDVKKAYNYSSGRINTQNKHDFTYGRFETRAKVPTGMGYLPAFWLMATDETNYGQWPQCGEIDIMEVMGQETNKSYHTIHYGYDSGAGHRQNQGTKTLETGDFSSEYHTYALDWEPGKLTWYVDGKEVYTTNDWFTGKDDESQLAYPAPFDQDFYVILNLAVGGSWVGYPTQEVVDDIIAGKDDQSFYVDYVRVYQKDAAVYEEEEEKAEKPVHEVVYREADANGNYVLNGDFAKAINAGDDASDNWVLHLESDGEGSTTKVENNEITITPSAVGAQNHSVQLKQESVPLYKGWEYELSFDAYADAARSIIVDIEGPDHGWTRYMQDTTFDLTTEKQTFTKTFTMEEKTDANGSLEFCLGKQDSTSPVHISNVKLVHKSGEEVEEVIEKSVRADGNYIYNGSFDQGDKRLGYWEMDEDDAARVTVTNKTVEGSNGKVRELCAKIDVPTGTSAVNPITISQSELAPIAAGKYEISFDAYMENGGSADAITIGVAGKEFTPEITTESKNYSKVLKIRENLTREDSNVAITFTKPGTYYLDNIMLAEAALIKNGAFNAGLSGFAPYIYTSDLASYVVDSINNPSSFVMTINDTGADTADNDWYIQLNQDNLTLEQGKTYSISFKAKSTIERKIRYALQKNGGDWANYSKTDEPINLTTEWQTFTKEFTMDNDTDTATRFNITMGSVGGERITAKHDVIIDDIELKEIAGAATPEQKDADKEAADAVKELIKAIGTVEATDACKAKIDAADEAYEKLTIDQQDLITDEEYSVLATAKKSYESLKKAADDKAAADAVVALINAIGKVEATDASKEAIEKASEAYGKLTDDQKSLVGDEDYKKLTDASTEYGKAMAAKAQGEQKTDEQKTDNQTTDSQKTDNQNTPAANATPATTAPTTPSNGTSNNNGAVEVGETAVTVQGTFTATSATTATYTPSETAKSGESVTVPATVKIDGKDVEVTEIPKDAFKGDTALKNITIGANITTIGEGAFQNATNLTSVKFESTKITTIAKNTFAGAKNLKSIDLSKQKNLKSIGANAFKGCKKLKTIKIYGNKLTKVNKLAFKGCTNKKSVKVTIFAKNKKQYNKIVKMIKKAGLKKATFKYKKQK